MRPQLSRSGGWLLQAERDLENARYEFEGGYHEWACFLAQQASGKAVKALYQRIGAEAFGDSAASLLKSLPEELSAPRDLIDVAKELDKAYIPTRYPNVHPEGPPYEAYTEVEARRLISYAEKVVGFCKDILSKRLLSYLRRPLILAKNLPIVKIVLFGSYAEEADCRQRR